jgi:DNA repair protein RecO (recombination protein O)
MDLQTPALVLAVLPHGEHGAVVRFLTPEHGLVAGYVRGGRSRRLRPILHVGNSVAVHLHARTDTQLAAANVELLQSRAVLGLDPMFAAACEWLASLTASLLSEHIPHDALYTGLDSILDAAGLGASQAQMLAALARYELLLLGELGFAPDLSCCVVTGSSLDLAYVSPKSSHAVGRSSGEPFADKLLPLPKLLIGHEPAPTWLDIAAALRTTGYFLTRDLLSARFANLAKARLRLVDLVQRRVTGG